jgi:hypothetical protein
MGLVEDDGVSKLQKQEVDEDDFSKSLTTVSLSLETIAAGIPSPTCITGRPFTKISTNVQNKMSAALSAKLLSMTTTIVICNVINTIETCGYFFPERRKAQVVNARIINLEDLSERIRRLAFARSANLLRVFGWASEELEVRNGRRYERCHLETRSAQVEWCRGKLEEKMRLYGGTQSGNVKMIGPSAELWLPAAETRGQHVPCKSASVHTKCQVRRTQCNGMERLILPVPALYSKTTA